MKFLTFEKEMKDKEYRDKTFLTSTFKPKKMTFCIVQIIKCSVSCSKNMCVKMLMEGRKAYMSAKTFSLVFTLINVKPIRTGI